MTILATESSQSTLDRAATSSAPACAHCGLPCELGAIRSENRIFCCLGCRTVFELLTEHGLDHYYDLEEAPGIPMLGRSAERFDYLDAPEITERLLDFRSETTSRVTFHVPTMHCVACLWLLENLFRLASGIGESRVDFPHRRLTVCFDHREMPVSRLVGLLASLGYEPALRLDDLDRETSDPPGRRLAMRIGVAGFALGNIMLLSFPAYLGLELATADSYARLFGWLSLFLALPVVVYSASDYWRAAWLAVRRRVLTIDFPIALGIAALFGQSAYEIVTATGEGYLDSLAGLLFLLLCGKWFQLRTYDRLSFDRDYKAYFPLAVNKRLPSGGEETIPLTTVAIGDRLVIRSGELVPADGRLTAGSAAIDYSFVTGESLPVNRAPGEPVYAGGRQVGGAIEIEVVKEVADGYLTSLWHDEAFRHRTEPTLDDLTNRMSRWFTAVVVLLATVAGAYWWISDPSLAIRAFVSVLIVACPCALALSAPFALGSAMRALGRRGLFLRDPSVVERLATIGTIVFDKTGTLTRAEEGTGDYRGQALDDRERAAVAAVAGGSAHPYARLARAALEASSATLQSYQEEPGLGLAGRAADLDVVCGSLEWLRQRGITVPVAPAEAGGSVHVAIDGRYRGRFSLRATYRNDLRAMFDQLRRRYRLALTSGDNDRERPTIEGIMGIDAELAFGQSPHDKLHLVRTLQGNNPVLMIGDGLNDAGALEQSDVGVAVSEDLSSFTPACDAILDADSLADLPAALRYSRIAVGVVVACFLVSFAYNAVGISFAASGRLSPLLSAILMPTSSVTVVAIAVGATQALARRILGAS